MTKVIQDMMSAVQGSALTIIKGSNTLINLRHKASGQVLNVISSLFALLPAAVQDMKGAGMWHRIDGVTRILVLWKVSTQRSTDSTAQIALVQTRTGLNSTKKISDHKT